MTRLIHWIMFVNTNYRYIPSASTPNHMRRFTLTSGQTFPPSLFTASPLTQVFQGSRSRAQSIDVSHEAFALNNLSASLCNDSGINECVSSLKYESVLVASQFLTVPRWVYLKNNTMIIVINTNQFILGWFLIHSSVICNAN